MKYILSLLLFITTLTVFSQIPQPLKDTYVNDFAKVLSKTDLKALNDSINQIEKRTGVQFAIVLVNTIPKEYQIEEYSLLIARRWKVGNNEDGLVYVAAIKQRKQRLEVAHNLEPIFTEENSQDVLNKIKPGFRAKNYNAGLSALVTSIAFKLDSAGYGKAPAVQTAAVDAKTAKDQEPAEKKSGSDNTLMTILVITIIGLLLYLVFRRPSGYVGGSAGGGYSSSGGGSGLGSFVAGAATGYMANELLDKNKDRRDEEARHEEELRREEEENRLRQEQEMREKAEEETRRAAERARSASTHGNWGASRGSSNGGSSSPSGGFSGGGATSDW